LEQYKQRTSGKPRQFLGGATAAAALALPCCFRVPLPPFDSDFSGLFALILTSPGYLFDCLLILRVRLMSLKVKALVFHVELFIGNALSY
jgi:hypothetical protein